MGNHPSKKTKESQSSIKSPTSYQQYLQKVSSHVVSPGIVDDPNVSWDQVDEKINITIAKLIDDMRDKEDPKFAIATRLEIDGLTIKHFDSLKSVQSYKNIGYDTFIKYGDFGEKYCVVKIKPKDI